MKITEISEQILSRGCYETDGATPAATVNAQIASSIKHDGERSPFIRAGKGMFALKNSMAVEVAPATPRKQNALKVTPFCGFFDDFADLAGDAWLHDVTQIS